MSIKITKSNAIINSSYRFSLNEMRIVLYGLSHIDPTADEFPLSYRIHIRDLAEFYNIGEKDRGSFYDDIKYALITKFWERDFSYFDEELGQVVKRRWLIEVRYGGKDGALDYHYNPLIKNELQKLARRFTSYFLTNVANMKSAYSMRIYEIAIMYLNASGRQKTVFTKKIEDLKYHLGISDKYKRFYHMKARVLEHAKKEINKHSDIHLSYQVIKQGRTPIELKFTATKRNPNKPKTTKDSDKDDQLSLSLNADTETFTLSPDVIEKAKQLARAANTNWDVYTIEQEFYNYMRQKKEPLKNLQGAFLGFVKKKIQQRA